MAPRVLSSSSSQAQAWLLRLSLCAAVFSTSCVFAVSFLAVASPPIETKIELYAVVLDAGSTGTRVCVYRVLFQENKCHGGLGQATVQVPALVSRRIGPGIALYAERQQGRKSQDRATSIDDLHPETQAQAYFKPDGHDSGEQHASLLASHVDRLERLKEAVEAGGAAGKPREAEAPHHNVNTERFGREDDIDGGLEEYLERLRAIVEEALPSEDQRRRAFLFFRGTAGMRALPAEKSERLLEQVRASMASWGLYLPAGSVGVTGGEAPRAGGGEGASGDARRATGEGDQGGTTAKKLRAGLVEMGGASAQVVIQLPPGLRPPGSYTPLASTVKLSERRPGDAAARGPEFPPIRVHRHAAVNARAGGDFVEVDLCTERHIVYSKSYMGLGRQHAMMEHIHDSVQHALAEHKAAIRAGQGLPPTREAPFEASIPCLPSDIRVHVRPSRLAQNAAFDEDLEKSLQDEEEDYPEAGRAAGVPTAAPSAARKEEETRGETSERGERESGRSKIKVHHPAGIPKKGMPSDEFMWAIMGDNGANMMDFIEKVAAQGGSSHLGCHEHVALRLNRVPDLPFEIHPDIALYATENFYHFNEYVLRAAGAPELSGAKLARAAARLCEMAEVRDVLQEIHPKAAKEKAQTACFGLVLMSEFLTRVLRLQRERELLAVNDINGVEISWTAGVPMLYLPHIIREAEGSQTGAAESAASPSVPKSSSAKETEQGGSGAAKTGSRDLRGTRDEL
ncbi:hypothetical protein BESB_003220 [Besnoitia besnoiti]|uniref:GDA1/CD39 (Nucleoside phosphatase) family protein n=1 Tax=Besnoitia besnoiti TaxID=94643 RepID=A0A2A9MN91_BESBE|nr:hypothetical protein BESB_003220 [Besnoitia besnoiti]PFH37981.1 hypothetical protein BESB_003220 [Besnoitia besnoiti]